MADSISTFVSFGVFVGACYFWLLSAINLFRVVANRKQGVPITDHWFNSPFNVVFRPNDLTERGLVARRRVFQGFFGFIGCFIVGAIAGLLAGF